MWRYGVGVAAALLLAVGGVLLFRGSAGPGILPVAAAPALAGEASGETELPESVPAASAKTREQRRFDRYDKDRDEAIGREEYLASRRKAFARLDANGDGRLSFEEWAAKTIDRFAGADADKSGSLTRTEFAATAPKRRATAPRCACAPAANAPAPAVKDEQDGEAP
jgi:EF hand